MGYAGGDLNLFRYPLLIKSHKSSFLQAPNPTPVPLCRRLEQGLGFMALLENNM